MNQSFTGAIVIFLVTNNNNDIEGDTYFLFIAVSSRLANNKQLIKQACILKLACNTFSKQQIYKSAICNNLMSSETQTTCEKVY